MLVGAGAADEDGARRIRERAVQDVLDGTDYLAAVFGIDVRVEAGEPRVYYVRDRRDLRLWIDVPPEDRRPKAAPARSGLSGPVAAKRPDSRDLEPDSADL